jgi:hypothetical protein
MGKRPKGAPHDGGETDIHALEMILDYAIIEGAELRLPLFVLLLRTARLELMSAYGGERRVETKITDCLGTESFAAPVPQPHQIGPAT